MPRILRDDCGFLFVEKLSLRIFIMQTKIYVGNIPFSTTSEELENLFLDAGKVVSVNLIKDYDTGRSRGFAFIEMTVQTEAEKAVSMFNGYRYEGRELKVNLARPRDKRGRGSTRGRSYGDRNRRY